MTTAAAPQGWYPDPQNQSQLRWWDGTNWGDQTQPSAYPPPPPASAPPPPPGPSGATSGPGVGVIPPAPETPKHRLFGGKKDLEEEVAQLRATVAAMGVPERDALRAEVAQLNTELPAMRAERASLEAALVPLRTETQSLQALRAQAAQIQGEVAQLTSQRDGLIAETTQLRAMTEEIPKLQAQYDELRTHVVETSDAAILQEVGVYEYRHPLTDAPAYKGRLATISDQIKTAVKSGKAVTGSTTWTVNGSKAEGNRMVREFSKLMLRAYNNEADNAVRAMKPYALESSILRLTKAKDTISKLGKTMTITVSDAYHHLRVTELELTADYLAKVAEQKERDRAERARLREEEIAQREYERERERLRKEHAHYEEAAAQLRAKGDHDAADQAEAKMAEIQDSIEGVNQRAANIRAGHVYVISNVGAFGPDMVKIGMTRRLDPMERVRELGDASVPFHYDLHAMVFADDAVTLESTLHHALAEWRVNLVNQRREFFRTTPSKVRDIILDCDASIITWVEEPEAIEWRQSETTRRALQPTGYAGA